ncbi:hypothetical protein M378DRAFT_16435 [Amanita muscaria Koide BX008]|uniref:NACHT domain-containing protein n=1 Tax=Amanita muscaria (strain Koide BX008) TaxID=946122 RepID=A0A0C2S3E0_AMAMK|nr:hypothetical protein M378DRAFT_16435 [Amanita muscaria Koide BX008]
MSKPIGFGNQYSHPSLEPARMLAGASNFTISGSARLYEIHGNAVINNLTDINELKKIQSIVNLPRAQASQKDYQTRKKSRPCFPGTREALLREMMEWANEPGEFRMYVLSGLAGIGKSTVAYTVATQADELGLLGASFFFSREEDARNNAKRFFCTIAYQLCVYNERFAKAIVDVLLTERGSAATTKNPQEQLQVLILDPLRSIIQSHAQPILVVVDALDECDEDDEHAVVMGLSQLVRLLPSFKVILTTRPRPLIDYLFGNHGNHEGHKIFRLQDIEDKIVDGDIRLYLSHSFSQEQVRARLLNPKEEWCASDEDIESLVKAAGRLFIIASTAILYVLNKTLGDPGARMKKLLAEIAQDRTPFHALNRFYSVIVCSAIQMDDDDDNILDRYQIIVGTIVVIQTPLPVATLACLIGEEPKKIYAMLRNLQPVILLDGDDVPRIYHKSFPDYLTDQARCKDPRLLIDPEIHHTQTATWCFEIMDKHLKRNILGLGDPARFMSNEDGLKEDGITDEQIQAKIPQQLRYACVFWVNHLEIANVKDPLLMNSLAKFADEHMLYWFEVLSLIGKLDLAHHAIRVVLKLLSTSSDLHQLLSDALRFISKFYETIKRSALHTYCSVLPFTPTDSLLYRRYIKEAEDNICTIEGGPERWGPLVANLSHGQHVQGVKSSLDSALFASYSEENVNRGRPGKLKIWDATTGTPISTFPGQKFAVANDFSTVASSEDNIITYYNVNGSAMGTMITASSTIQQLAISSESSRVAAALLDGTIWLWDSKNAELIDSFDGSEGYWPLFQFSPTGTRLAYSWANGIIKLRDGISGRIIADLHCRSKHDFEFSADGSRIASLSRGYGLGLWNSESGVLISAVRNVVRHWDHVVVAISANGSLLATGDQDKVKLWSGSNDSLALVEVLEVDSPQLLAFSPDNIFAVAIGDGIKLYDIKTHSFISTLALDGYPAALAFSPDCTRLAVCGNIGGRVYLWDVRGIDAFSLSLKEETSAVTALALSRDSSRLACGFEDGTVELWGTSPTMRRIGTPRSKMGAIFFGIFPQSRQAHTEAVRALGFGPDGRLFASGSVDRTIKLWNGGDGLLRGTLKAPRRLLAVSVSNTVLAAVWDCGVTLWSLDTLIPIRTIENGLEASTVSIAENNSLIAIAYHHRVSLLDAMNHTTIATFDIPYSRIHTMTFLPDNSQLVAQSGDGTFLSINLINKDIVKGPTLEHLIQLPNIPLWHGVPVWHCQEGLKTQHYFSALFPQHKSPVPVLWIPVDLHVESWTHGSSMIALGCGDGRVILLRPSTSRVG